MVGCLLMAPIKWAQVRCWIAVISTRMVHAWLRRPNEVRSKLERQYIVSAMHHFQEKVFVPSVHAATCMFLVVWKPGVVFVVTSFAGSNLARCSTWWFDCRQPAPVTLPRPRNWVDIRRTLCGAIKLDCALDKGQDFSVLYLSVTIRRPMHFVRLATTRNCAV